MTYESPYIYHREGRTVRPPLIYPYRWGYRIFAFEVRSATQRLNDEAIQRLSEKNWVFPSRIVDAVSQSRVIHRGAFVKFEDSVETTERLIVDGSIKELLGEDPSSSIGEHIRQRYLMIRDALFRSGG